jgi:ribosome-associated protein
MDSEKIISELQFRAVRSSGAGGQNVNKVSSKVVLSFDVEKSDALSSEEKLLLETKLQSRLTSDKMLILNCDEGRSQLRNKDIVTKRFLDLIEKSLVVPKTRKVTKIPRSVIKKRLHNKKTLSQTKQSRKKPNLDSGFSAD